MLVLGKSLFSLCGKLFMFGDAFIIPFYLFISKEEYLY